jgi:hypothetical protein
LEKRRRLVDNAAEGFAAGGIAAGGIAAGGIAAADTVAADIAEYKKVAENT